MNKRLTLIFVFILLLATSGCASSGSESGLYQTNSQSAEGNIELINVQIDISVDISDKFEPEIRGETNLPDGTIIMTSVSSVEQGVYMAQDETFVNQGVFIGGPFGTQTALPVGLYEASATMVVPILQPEEVQEIIGKDGEYLTGILVKENSFGSISANAVKEFQIGSTEDIEEQAIQTNSDITLISESIRSYIQYGREMETLRSDDKIAECGKLMREYQGEVEKNEIKISTLPKPANLLLGSANINLKLCVSCMDNALDNCDLAENDLLDYENNYASQEK